MEQAFPPRVSVRVLVVGMLLVVLGLPALVWRATAEVGYDVITTLPAQRPTPPPVANAVAAFGVFLITVGVVMIIAALVGRRRGGVQRGR